MFRPVSLIPIISKIFQSLIKDDLETYVGANSNICKNQYGFRKKKLTCASLLDYLHDLTELPDQSL